MQINAKLFHTAAVIYQALLERKENRVPMSPEHAEEARALAVLLFQASKENGMYALAAAHCLVGFMKNPVSAHATREELVNLALHGANQIVQCFAEPIAVEVQKPISRANISSAFGLPVPSPSQQTPQMPPQNFNPQAELPVPPPAFEVPKATPTIPDFEG